MAKRKYKLHQLHKIKVHHNRWLIWAIAYVVIVSIAVLGYIKVSDVNFESGLFAETQYKPFSTYTNNTLGFSLRYPSTWSIEAEDSETVSFSPASSSKEGFSVRVTKPANEVAIRKGIDKLDEMRVVLDGNRAVKLVNDLGNGVSETVIMSIYKEKLYVLRGDNDEVNKLLLSFRFQ